MNVLENSPRMKFCSLKPYIPHICSQKIEWHHNLIFGGRQSDIPETIISICEVIHNQARNSEVKERLDWIMLNQMKPEDIKAISKATNYNFIKDRLNKKYGQY